MASFYGNIKNNSRASFIFDRFYPSRSDMEDALKVYTDQNGVVQGDGVFVNRYVLVNYGYTQAGLYARIDPAYCQPAEAEDDPKYIVNRKNYTDFYIYNSSDRVYEKATEQLTDTQLSNAYFYYKKTNFIDRFDDNIDVNGDGSLNTLDISTSTEGIVENFYFADNRNKDRIRYNADYHLTVWMKIYSDNEERYIQVGRLKAEAPAFQIIIDAPGEIAPHFDLLQSSDINYMYHVPRNWDVRLNEQTLTKDLDDNNRTITYPYFNIDGFSETTTHRDGTLPAAGAVPAYNGSDTTNQIKILEYNLDGTKYPIHVYSKIDVTPDTYMPNWYYYYTGTQTEDNIPSLIEDPSLVEFTKNDIFDASRTYFIKTQKMTNRVGDTSEQVDSRQITIQLPAIGNAVSDLYDVLYGTNGNNANRPYDRATLFKYQDISPYNNLTSADDISMGWAMEEFKNYISELRFLSKGQGYRIIGYTTEDLVETYTIDNNDPQQIIQNNNYNLTSSELQALRPYDFDTGYIIPVYAYDDSEYLGLQSDWTLDDTSSFGYIYHKPRILWSNATTPTATSSDTNYMAARTIEYIYDNYKSETTIQLFGPTRNNEDWLNARH